MNNPKKLDSSIEKPLKFNKLREMIPLINEDGLNASDVAKLCHVHRVTVMKWAKRLREAGYEVKLNDKGGRPKLEV